MNIISVKTKKELFDLLDKYITTVPNFPKEGIQFKNINPLLKNIPIRDIAINAWVQFIKTNFPEFNVIAGLEARGFHLGMALAIIMGKEFVAVRKQGKLPNATGVWYEKEYGKDWLGIENGLLKNGDRVLVIDDLLATAGTAIAACQVVKLHGGEPIGVSCLIELVELQGAEKIHKAVPNIKCGCLLQYPPPPINNNNHETTIYKEIMKSCTEYKPVQPVFVHSDLNKPVLMYHPSMKSIANNILAHSNLFREGVINWLKFPDGQPNIEFEGMDTIRNKDVVFLASMFDSTQLMEQVSVCIALSRQFVNSLTIVLPYYAVATMERVEEEGILASAETFFKIITSCLLPTKTGPPVMYIYDIHALPVRFYGTDNVYIKTTTAIPLLLNEIETLQNNRQCICFPDDGAAKRFKKKFGDKFPYIVCSKVRDGDSRKINIVDKYGITPNNEHQVLDHVVIIDDIAMSGSTLIECKHALVKYRFKNVSAYVTHAVFPNNSHLKVIQAGFHTFWVTNTNPMVVEKLRNVHPFKIIDIDASLANEVAQHIKKDSIDYKNSIVFDPQRNFIINIHVASTNQEKLKAAKMWAERKFGRHFHTRIYGYDVPSCVSNQPFGLEETKQGALNRHNTLQKFLLAKYQNDDCIFCHHIVVSMENGIFQQDDDNYSDKAIIIASALDTADKASMCLAETDAVKDLPRDLVIQSIHTHNKHTTFGKLYETKYGCNSWFLHFCNTPRSTILYDALMKLDILSL